jgi:hypothetical protein
VHLGLSPLAETFLSQGRSRPEAAARGGEHGRFPPALISPHDAHACSIRGIHTRIGPTPRFAQA